jgi:serine protease DegQ
VRRAVLLVLLLTTLLVGCSGGGDEASEPRATSASTTTEEQSEPVAAGGGAAGSLAAVPDIVQEVEPSVVAVELDRAAGSGVIWSENGIIVTNHHVVERGDEIQVVFASGRREEARVRASDEVTDLAVLEVEAENLPAATFADARPRVGELAVAIGNPFGFENSVTAGVVSGLERSFPAGARSESLVGLIQTDAAISPGNSGGALVNQRGEVIGINVAYLPPQQLGAVSIGFAIPIPVVRNVVEQLLDDGEAEHAFLGVRPSPLTPQVVDRFGLETKLGVLVASVVSGSAAEQAGLETGDVIVRIDDQEMRQVDDVLSLLREHVPGDRINVAIVRDDEERTIEVELRDRPG